MIKHLLILLLILYINDAKAQYSFKPQKSYQITDISFIDSIFRIEKDFDFQYRL